MRDRIVMIVAVLAMLGCATSVTPEMAHLPHWRERRAVEAAREQQRSRGAEEGVTLFGSGKSRAAVKVDEDGKPRLRLGDERTSRWNIDVDVDTSELDVEVEYRIPIGKSKRGKKLPPMPRLP